MTHANRGKRRSNPLPLTFKEEETMSKGAFETFYANQTPENAVRLAIADHRVGDVVNWEFLEALEKAADLLAAQNDTQ